MGYNRIETLNCENNPDKDCAVDAALSIIGGKWKLKIYKVLKAGGPFRYAAIHKALTGISEKTLSAQLRELEEDGIVTKQVFPEVPPRVEYTLTDLGISLEPVFVALINWGQTYIQTTKTVGQSAQQA
ncbi:MarR family transcriptional regulator [Niastella yeongjuensis]|uniref:MarR family transcriptional regulator n=1 Tax=Niastella yeongjuensis TaxID=354355 RepID=A0A1V9EL93_9BACT|nr:helix-turn-helix domain-containing protein [Niastella yeongjuensis]OQP46920.1 MarR family transcriptional regulator [Niastella yeongjuensis]SEN60662.1 transcriptional regulator, HxlR family [Niastella yeongjuensis]